MNRLSIAQRLYVGLGLIIVVGLGMTVAALVGLSRIEGQWEVIEKSSLVRLDLVLDATKKFSRGVHAFKNVVLRGPDYESPALSEMEGIEEAARRYEALPVSQDEKTYLDALRTGITNYKAAVQKVAGLKRDGRDTGEVDKSVKGMDRPVEDAIEGLRQLIIKEVDANSAIFHEALQDNKHILLMGLIITACFGLLLGYNLVRSIESGLAVANATLDSVAKGDFSKEINRSRRDEIGQLLNRAADMSEVLKAFMAAQLEMARAHNEEGRISQDMGAAAFPGAYGDMARNLNTMVKGHIDVQTRFTELMSEYAGGKFDNRMPPLPGERKAISDAAEKVCAGLEASAKAAQFNAGVKTGLDSVSIPVRIADNDGRIIYVNRALNEVLHKNEAAFRQMHPAFDADKVVGGSLGMFFPDPKAAVDYVRGLQSVTRSRLILGGRNYNIVTTPVVGENGVRLGTTAEWSDVTEQLAAEKEVAAIVEAAAAGDFRKRILEADKSGFMLQMAQGLNAILGTSEHALGEISRILKALAEGDLSQDIRDDFKGVFAELKDNSNETIARLREIIAQIRESSQSINMAAREIATGNNDLSQRTEEQASSLEETAASLEEIASAVRHNADNAQEAARLASEASQSAVRGGEVVAQVVTTMAGITESNREIAAITTLIDGIAFQTNLLALNAAVEAARAGEQGRGFAVVASEVRTLAQRAAEAAKNIKAVIANSVGKVDEGARFVQGAGAVMEEIVIHVQRVNAIIGEIAAANKEQSVGIEQVNQAVTSIDQITQQNAALVEEAAAAAKSLEDQSGALVRSVAAFKVDEEKGARAMPVLRDASTVLH